MKLGTIVSKKRLSVDDNLIPLINVVFLMLVFFMVAGHIQRSETTHVQPPESTSDLPLEENNVVLMVTHEGVLYLEGEVVGADSLALKLLSLFKLAVDPEKFLVLVKVDASLPVENLQSILQIIKSVGLTRVSLVTRSLNTVKA